MKSKNSNDPTSKPTIRTITAFVTLSKDDFQASSSTENYEFASFPILETKIQAVVKGLKLLQGTYEKAGYNIQTLRIATNPFGEWLVKCSDDDCYVEQKRLNALDHLLTRSGIFACGVGPAQNIHELACCRQIVRTSDKFSCSFILKDPTDASVAMKAAQVIYDISSLHPEGLNNFQFCIASSTCRPYIPFFPIAYHQSDKNETTTATEESIEIETENPIDNDDSSKNEDDVPETQNSFDEDNKDGKDDEPLMVKFAIGLENGPFVRKLIQESGTIANIDTIFRLGMVDALLPIQDIANRFSNFSSSTGENETQSSIVEKLDYVFRETMLKNMFQSCRELADDFLQDPDKPQQNVTFEFVGIDTSVNPSLDDEGSVAGALECLDEISRFGGPGTMAAASAITKVLQSLEGIKTTGYCGLMLPVCEDKRLAKLSATGLSIVHLLNISSVCGVGVDTVPIPGNTIDNHDKALSSLSSLLLDVVSLAERWKKPLTCRVFPYPGKKEGDIAHFRDSPHMVSSSVFSLGY